MCEPFLCRNGCASPVTGDWTHWRSSGARGRTPRVLLGCASACTARVLLGTLGLGRERGEQVRHPAAGVFSDGDYFASQSGIIPAVPMCVNTQPGEVPMIEIRPQQMGRLVLAQLHFGCERSGLHAASAGCTPGCRRASPADPGIRARHGRFPPWLAQAPTASRPCPCIAG
jgi:hypothetical protein